MIGIVLGDRYTILENIGSGGMAIVYKAKDKLLGRFVAVKVLRREHFEDAEFVRRFDVEAQAAASLNHPHVVSIYDVGRQDDISYIVMEYVEGVTLKEYLSKNGALPWKKALNFSLQICSALEHAHSKHIIHRDIKPHNIIVSQDDELKVTDFGIARATSSVTTNVGTNFLGSAHYLSPEQARGGFTDERSDIYSLGVCMYEMFTGTLPFNGESPVSVAMQHLQKEPMPPSSVIESLPKSIEAIILKTLNKEQRQRYSSAKELYADLTKVYVDPNTTIQVEEQSEDIFSTKKIPIITDAIAEEHKEEPIKREPRKEEPKKRSKEDKVAIYAGIGTSIVIVALLIIFMFKIFPYSGGDQNKVIVPNLIGMTEQEALDTLENSGLNLVVEKKSYSTPDEIDTIIKQTPQVDAKVKVPSDIYITISLGGESYELPDYTSWDYVDAQKDIIDRGLKCVIHDEDNDELNIKYPEDRVTKQIPAARAELKAGETVTLYKSVGNSKLIVAVPSLIGLSEAEATNKLESVGLVKGNVTQGYKEGTFEGLVIGQSIGADTQVAKNQVVSIVINVKPAATPVPTSDIETEKNFSFDLPSSDGKMLVTVTRADTNEEIYHLNHSSQDRVSINVRGKGTIRYDIYVNGNYYKSETVNF